jgi:predicted SnoaL-like aldol condensation-catalyzing enzyme
VFADGGFVPLHVHVKFKPEDPGLAIVEIFRLEGGGIVEHWDVRQPVPDASANDNGCSELRRSPEHRGDALACESPKSSKE